MAADARIGAASLRHHGRGIVRAAGAEIRDPHRDILGVAQHALGLPEAGDAARQILVGRVFEQALAQTDRDVV